MGSRMMQGEVKWEVIRVLEGSDFNFRKNLCTRSVAVITSYKTSFVTLLNPPEAVDMNGRFQMQGGKNWFLPKEMNANRFFWDSHWLEIWSNHFYPSMGTNGGSVAMDSAVATSLLHKSVYFTQSIILEVTR